MLIDVVNYLLVGSLSNALRLHGPWIPEQTDTIRAKPRIKSIEARSDAIHVLPSKIASLDNIGGRGGASQTSDRHQQIIDQEGTKRATPLISRTWFAVRGPDYSACDTAAPRTPRPSREDMCGPSPHTLLSTPRSLDTERRREARRRALVCARTRGVDARKAVTRQAFCAGNPFTSFSQSRLTAADSHGTSTLRLNASPFDRQSVTIFPARSDYFVPWASLYTVCMYHSPSRSSVGQPCIPPLAPCAAGFAYLYVIVREA